MARWQYQIYAAPITLVPAIIPPPKWVSIYPDKIDVKAPTPHYYPFLSWASPTPPVWQNRAHFPDSIDRKFSTPHLYQDFAGARFIPALVPVNRWSSSYPDFVITKSPTPQYYQEFTKINLIVIVTNTGGGFVNMTLYMNP